MNDRLNLMYCKQIWFIKINILTLMYSGPKFLKKVKKKVNF